MTSFRRPLVTLAVACMLSLAMPLGWAAAARDAGPSRASTARHALMRVTDRPVLPARAVSLGPVAPSAMVTGAVALKPRHEELLTRFIDEVTQPGSPLFHHYLSLGQYRRSFGPTPATVSSVQAFLRSSGLRTPAAPRNGLLVPFRGPAGRVETTFHTELERYRLPSRSTGEATTGAVLLPEALAPSVEGVLGLDNLVKSQSRLYQAPASMRGRYPAAEHDVAPHLAVGPNACAHAVTDAQVMGGLTDAAIARAYGADPLYRQGDTGARQTVAIYELEPYLRSDIQTFDACYFGKTAALQMMKRLHTVPVDGGQPSGGGSGEALLDIQDVSAMAPGATIDVYTAPNSSFGGIDDYNVLVADDKADIVTSSWGFCEQAIQQGLPGQQQAEDYILQEAAAQGMTVFNATGDTGDNECNAFRTPVPSAPVLSAGDPASQPYVVGVAGTTIDDATQPPLERVWNDGPEWGSGTGGISQSWEAPSWQQAPLVPGIHSGADAASVGAAEKIMGNKFCQTFIAGHPTAPCRQTPDVSAQADEFTGAATFYTELAVSPATPTGWITIGGTSSASPLWAGLLALVNASSTCASNPETKQGAGFALPLLYDVASNPVAYRASFNDIRAGNNDIYDIDSGKVFPASTGYDMATGLGSPQLTAPNGGDGLAYYLCSLGAAATRPAVSSLDPSLGPAAGGNHVTIHGAGFGTVHGAGFVSEVAGVSVGSVNLPAHDFSASGPTTITLVMPKAAEDNAPASPADGAGRADVTVTMKDGASSRVTPGAVYDYVDESATAGLPAVYAASPYGGTEAGGNTVRILGSGFASSGPDKTTAVTVGGVPAKIDRLTSSYSMTVTAPAYRRSGTGATVCATAKAISAETDMCQVQVVVSNHNGSSAVEKILPSYEGPLDFNALGVLPPPPGCGCEVYPQPSEYDYIPAPRITSVSTSGGPADYASESGSTTISIRGRGFNPFTLNGIYVGAPGKHGFDESELTFPSFETGTEVQFTAPGQNSTSGAFRVPVTAWTLAGYSPTSKPGTEAIYAGTPAISQLSRHLAPDTGGAFVRARGNGMEDVIAAQVTDVSPPGNGTPPFSFATIYKYNILNSKTITLLTPGTDPGYVYLQFCTVTACSTGAAGNQMTLYPPGNPSVALSSPETGPAHGGTTVAVVGQNLGCATQVFFGATAAASFANGPSIFLCNMTGEVSAVSPPGQAGTTEKLTVTTAESQDTGYGPSKPASAAEFTYTKSSPSAPRDLAGKPGVKSVSLSWQAPITTGGDPITRYELLFSSPGNPAASSTFPAGATSGTVTGLVDGRTYDFVLRAVSKLGAGLPASVSAVPKQ